MDLSLCFYPTQRQQQVKRCRSQDSEEKKPFESCEGPNLSELGVNRRETSGWGEVEKVGTGHETTFIGHVEMLEMCSR